MESRPDNNSRRRGRPAVKAPRLEATLRDRLRSGEWSVGALLPSENTLSRKYGVSRMTLRGVIGKLEAEGWIVRVQGKGTFVNPQAPLAKPDRRHLAIILNQLSAIPGEEAYRRQLSFGMQRALQDSGFSCTIHGKDPAQPFADFLRENEPALSMWGGLLVTSEALDQQCLERLTNKEIAVVGLAIPPAEVAIPYVDVDNVAGGDMAMRCLLEAGWRKPAVLDQFSGVSFAQDRQTGYETALRTYGITLDIVPFIDMREVHTAKGQEEAASRIRPLLRSRSIDSVIVYMEHPTIGVYRAIEEAGLQVGKDIAVVHYNDYPWLRDVLRPQPTAIRQPFEKVGYEATLLLQNLMHGKPPPQTVLAIQPELIRRESCPNRCL